MKHTQGPWELGKMHYYNGERHCSLMGTMKVYHKYVRAFIGQIYLKEVNRHEAVLDEEGQNMINQSIQDYEANAKLIASAPELLKTLNNVEKSILLEINPSNHLLDTLNEVREAIKKATE